MLMQDSMYGNKMMSGLLQVQYGVQYGVCIGAWEAGEDLMSFDLKREKAMREARTGRSAVLAEMTG